MNKIINENKKKQNIPNYQNSHEYRYLNHTVDKYHDDICFFSLTCLLIIKEIMINLISNVKF